MNELVGDYSRGAKLAFGVQAVFAAALLIGAYLYAGAFDNAVPGRAVPVLRWLVIFLAAASLGVRRRMFRRAVLAGVFTRSGARGVLRRLRTGTTLSVSLAAAVAVVGSLVVALGGYRIEVLTFGAVSLALFWAAYPREAGWERLLVFLTSENYNDEGQAE